MFKKAREIMVFINYERVEEIRAFWGVLIKTGLNKGKAIPTKDCLIGLVEQNNEQRS